ncbi:flagellar motor switch protein FliG [Hydrogenobaculum sp. Y04AAS1]|uniref:flagellar motor switch protein FliG n=1 Tax=Hydrogenobaculum sp. (strain Y04AAS1) TaxID=380749 RepID=UPI00015BCD17|nr:flagellar motor switch protein FliG [Hydrogenobaculum sp. Y04AAS1]HCT65878.1 flagellar motor switch protein FliG [Hydrogenobaculum sp.]
MPIDKLTKAQKAAVLMMALPPEVSVEIMKELDESELQDIFLNMNTIQGITLQDVEEIAKEFLQDYQETTIVSPDTEQLLEFARRVLPPEKFAKIYEFVSSSTIIKSFQELEKVDIKVLASLLAKEHPQTIAVVLSQLSPMRAADVLQYLPENIAVEVTKRLATLENISPEFLGELIENLAEEIRGIGLSGFSQKTNGLVLAAEVLNLLDKKITDKILNKIEQEDKYLAERIKDKMFVFEDIEKLGNRDIVEILKAVNKNTLMVALKGASDAIKGKFFSNMSNKAATIMKEDMEAMGPVRVSEVEKAQKEIIAVIKKLADEGKIDLTGGASYE